MRRIIPRSVRLLAFAVEAVLVLALLFVWILPAFLGSSQLDKIAESQLVDMAGTRTMVAGCFSAALRDPNLAAPAISSDGKVCASHLASLIARYRSGLLTECGHTDMKCLFTEGYVAVVVYSSGPPKVAKEARAELQRNIDEDFERFLKGDN